MNVIPSKVRPNSDEYRQREAAMGALLETIHDAMQTSLDGGGPKYNERHLRKGKLLPRERIELLLDRDRHFLELMPLAGHSVRGCGTGAGVVGGIGVVSGVECVISASEATVKGGAINEIGLRKGLRLQEVAEANQLPVINLTESAGADLPNQSKIFIPGGETFRNITRLSKAGLPSVCIVFGNATAGGAYVPGMSDYAIFVKDQAKVFLAGPPLVKMATGEVSDDESLGGAEMHATTSGVADYLAKTEHEALRMARDVIGHINWRKPHLTPDREPELPIYDPEELLGIVSTDIKKPFDQMEVIARIVDGSRFEEFKAGYGPTLICGWAYLHGYLVGVLANNGVLFSESANKGAQFIQLCNQRGIPLVFLQNITGFMVGKEYEQGGIIKHGAKLINAVANSDVPLLTVMTGASFGAGNYGMAGRAYEPRMLYSWPNHRIAVMGGEQLAGVLDIIKRQAAARRNEEVNEKQLSQLKAMLEGQIERESQALFATSHLWDDGIIDPRDTRDVLGISLSAVLNRRIAPSTSFGVFRH